jgi:hypothetical protein
MEGGFHNQEITDVLVIWCRDPHISPSMVEDEWKPLKSQDSRGAYCLPSHRSGTTSQATRVTPHKSPFLPPTIGVHASSEPRYHFPNTRTSLLPGRHNEAIRLPVTPAIPHRFPITPAIPHRLPLASALTLALQSILRCHILFARPCLGAVARQVSLHLHLHGGVVGPHPRHAAANVDPPSLVGGFPRAGGGSPADSQPPPPSLPPPSNDTNVDPPSITGALPGAGGVLLVDIQHPPPSLPWKLKFTVTLPAGGFASESDSQADTNSSEDRCHGYNPLVPRRDALCIF